MTQLCLNFSNILYLVSYGVRDVLMLRILSVCAMLVAMPYYFWHQGQTAWIPIYWNSAFMMLNTGWIVRLILDRLPPRFTPDERKLYEYAFHHSCTPREMLQLLSQGEWREAQTGDVLARHGEVADRLIVVHTGEASARIRGREVARLRDGDLIGEMSFLTNAPMVADTIALGPVRYVCWQRKELDHLLERRLDLKVAIQAMIGQNLVERLSGSMPNVPELSMHVGNVPPSKST